MHLPGIASSVYRFISSLFEAVSTLGMDSSFLGSACPSHCWRRSLRAEMNCTAGSRVSLLVGLAGGWLLPVFLMSSL